MSGMALPLKMQGGWIAQSHSLGAQVLSGNGAQALADIAGGDALGAAAMHTGISWENYRHGRDAMELTQGEPHPLGALSHQIAGLGVSMNAESGHVAMQSTPAMPGLDDIARGRG